MTSADTLGYGTSSNVSTVMPSVTVNTSIPDEKGIPQPTRNKVSSVEAAMSNSIGASTATTYTATPQQIADFLTKCGFVSPAMDGKMGYLPSPEPYKAMSERSAKIATRRSGT